MMGSEAHEPTVEVLSLAVANILSGVKANRQEQSVCQHNLNTALKGPQGSSM